MSLKALKLLALFLCAAVACGTPQAPDDGGDDIITPDPVALELVSFALDSYPDADILIDNAARSVSVSLPYGSRLSATKVSVGLPEGVSSKPADGESVDLNSFKAIYLSNEEGTAAKFAVSIEIRKSPSTNLVSMTETHTLLKARLIDDAIAFTLPYGMDLHHLSLSVETNAELTYSHDLSDIDLSLPIDLVVTAADGKTTRTVALSASNFPQDTGVRGIYLPSPSHTSSFLSYSEVCKSVDLLAELNFNCLFVCAWATSKTAWESDVLLANSTWQSKSAGNLYSHYTGGSGDAIRDIIDVAHARGIKVILWFEYGFMHAWGGVNRNDPVLAKHPGWMGTNEDGKDCNYNGTDYYYNAYNSEVQEFLLDLMKEAVAKYPDVDGIQGDDRLPAMPRDSGYDTATMERYLSETGNPRPRTRNEEPWVRWRLDILNAFAKRMHTELKALKPSLIVCFAPNKYPWCENALMQDWPGWIADGAVDLLTVQCYVVPTYQDDVDLTIENVKAKTSANIFNPAMILKNGSNILPLETLSEQLHYNRTVGTCGESQFWFDGLKEEGVKDMFKLWYNYPVAFPAL